MVKMKSKFLFAFLAISILSVLSISLVSAGQVTVNVLKSDGSPWAGVPVGSYNCGSGTTDVNGQVTLTCPNSYGTWFSTQLTTYYTKEGYTSPTYTMQADPMTVTMQTVSVQVRILDSELNPYTRGYAQMYFGTASGAGWKYVGVSEQGAVDMNGLSAAVETFPGAHQVQAWDKYKQAVGYVAQKPVTVTATPLTGQILDTYHPKVVYAQTVDSCGKPFTFWQPRASPGSQSLYGDTAWASDQVLFGTGDINRVRDTFDNEPVLVGPKAGFTKMWVFQGTTDAVSQVTVFSVTSESGETHPWCDRNGTFYNPNGTGCMPRASIPPIRLSLKQNWDTDFVYTYPFCDIEPPYLETCDLWVDPLNDQFDNVQVLARISDIQAYPTGKGSSGTLTVTNVRILKRDGVTVIATIPTMSMFDFTKPSRANSTWAQPDAQFTQVPKGALNGGYKVCFDAVDNVGNPATFCGCEYNPPQVCGNGIVEGTEVCDDGDTTNPETCGVGACQMTVPDTCINSGLTNECTPVQCVPGTPTTEVCNGLDDDCDGTVDNVDADMDGVYDCGADRCLGSVADNAVDPKILVLNPVQYAQLDLSTSAFEAGPKLDQSIVYNMQTTYGCTCKQIAAALGVGWGHIKKGCSSSVMMRWTGLSNQPDRDAYIGTKKGAAWYTGMAIAEGDNGPGLLCRWFGWFC